MEYKRNLSRNWKDKSHQERPGITKVHDTVRGIASRHNVVADFISVRETELLGIELCCELIVRRRGDNI